MARVFKRKDRLSAMSEINVTSLLDLVFCLLIIFMITTPLMEQTMPIQLPTQSRDASLQPSPKDQYKSVSMDAQGNMYFEHDRVTSEELLARLQTLAQEPNPPIIDIRRAATVTAQQETDMLDILTKSGLKRFSFDTQLK